MIRILAVSFVAILLIIAVPALKLLATGDFTGSSDFYGFEEDSEIVDFILTLHETYIKK